MTSWTCSGWSMTEYHSARAAARRLPFSDSGRCSELSSPTTSSRAVTCDMLGRVPSVCSSRSSSAVKPAREEFAIDHALGKAVDAAEAHAASTSSAMPSPTRRLLREPSVDETIAHHDPVGQLAVDEAALAARLAHHVGVVAFAGDARNWSGSSVPSTSKSTKLSLSGVISVSAIECASRIR